MGNSTREIVIGAVSLLVVVLLFVAGYGGRELAAGAAETTYDVFAKFSRVDGLVAGADVRLGGIQIGEVSHQSLDTDYRAVLTLRIDRYVKLPLDTSAAIHTDGLFGSKYIVLEPGGDEDFLESGDEITFTQGAVVVADLLELIIAQGKANRDAAKTKQEK